jgi:hypothetical protein
MESDVGLVSSIRWYDVADRAERYSPADVARVYQATNAHTNFLSGRVRLFMAQCSRIG